jgi:hypothetical protein
MGGQTRIEQQSLRSGRPDLEALSRPTAFSFGHILAHTGNRARGSLESIGQSLGRLVYTLDAVVDRERDRRNQQFNPFLLQPRLIDGIPDLLDCELNTIASATRDLPMT